MTDIEVWRKVLKQVSKIRVRHGRYTAHHIAEATRQGLENQGISSGKEFLVRYQEVCKIGKNRKTMWLQEENARACLVRMMVMIDFEKTVSLLDVLN